MIHINTKKMEIVMSTPMGGGKTYALAEMCRKNDFVLVMHDAAAAKHVISNFPGLKAIGLEEIKDDIIFKGKSYLEVKPGEIHIFDHEAVRRMVIQLEDRAIKSEDALRKVWEITREMSEVPQTKD